MDWSADGPFERLAAQTPGLVRLRRAADGLEVWFTGVARDALAATPARLEVAADGARATAADGRGGTLEARAWRTHEPRPRFYDAALAHFVPTRRERRVARLLLALLRVPGTVGLLRRWHARRG